MTEHKHERPLDYSTCARPHCPNQEGRIDNYCSVYCRDVDELQLEIDALLMFKYATEALSAEDALRITKKLALEGLVAWKPLATKLRAYAAALAA